MDFIKNNIWSILLFLCLAVPGFFFFGDSVGEEKVRESRVVFENGRSVLIEIADTEMERRIGLSDRDYLEAGTGLLFVHDVREVPSYWMKGMRFSIDFIWIDNGEIVDLTQNAPPEDPAITYYSPSSPITHVLEVNAGFIEEYDLSVGDTLDIVLLEQ